jgi:hypothetical protein
MAWAMAIPFLVEIEMLLFDLKLFEDLSKVTVVRRGHDQIYSRRSTTIGNTRL